MNASLNITVVRGGAASGKTAYLANRAKALAEAGVEPEEILVAMPSATACRAFSRRLAQVSPEIAERVTVRTAQDVCLDTIARSGDMRVRRAMGVEWTFVLADLRASGFDGITVRRCLDAIFARWRQGDFALPDGEPQRDVQARLEELLATYRLLAPSEVAARAAHEGSPHTYTAVLVDDAQNLSRVTLEALASAASEEFVATWDEESTIRGFDEGAGDISLNELTSIHNAEVVDLPAFLDGLVERPDASPADAHIKAFAQAAAHADCSIYDRLCDVGAISFDDQSIALLKWRTPDDEPDSIAKFVRSVVDEGAALPGEIYVAVPNRTWGIAMRRALTRRWLDVSMALDDEPVRGNPAKPASAAPYLAYAKAALLADAHDAMAWRIWCGAGQADLGAASWRMLEKWARSESTSLAEAIDRITQGAAAIPASLATLATRIQEGSSFVERNRGLTGFSLTQAVFDGLPADPFDLDDVLAGTEDTAQLVDAIRAAAYSRTFDFDPNHVLVGSYRGLAGLAPRVVVMAGAMDGFIPSAACFDKNGAPIEGPALSDQRAVFSAAASKARDRLVISTFQRADQELACKLRLRERRSRVDADKRVSMLSRSRFIDDAGNAAPGSQSGEQFIQ